MAAAPSTPTLPAPTETPSVPKQPSSTMAASFQMLENLGRTPLAEPAEPKTPVQRAKDAKAPEPKPEPKKDGKPQPKAVPREEPPKEVAEIRPGADPDEPEGEEPAEETEGAPQAEETSTPQTPEKQTGIKNLRTELGRLKAEVRKRDEEITALKSTPREDPEKKTLSERLEAAQKRLQEYEENIRFTNYEKSQEYQDQWQKPYVTAYNSGRHRATTLKVVERQDESGQITQQARQGTAEDFDRIMSFQLDHDAATDLAEKLFGRNAHVVLNARDSTLAAHERKMMALEDAQKNATEREKQRAAMETQSQQARIKSFQEAIKAKHDRYDYLKANDGDESWNEALGRGGDLVDKVFFKRDQVKPEELLKADAAVYARAKAFSTLNLQNKRMKQKIAELESQLSEYKGSEPGGGEGDRGTNEPPPTSTLDGAFRELEKRARKT